MVAAVRLEDDRRGFMLFDPRLSLLNDGHVARRHAPFQIE
jgi:hypothetical protein